MRACVEEFYQRLLDDPSLSYFFDDISMAKLKQHQLAFFKLAFTKVPDNVDVPALLLAKHKRLFAEKGLNATHFDLVAEHFVATLQHLGVSGELIEEAVGVVVPLRVVFEEGALLYGNSSAVVEEAEEKKEADEGDKPGVLHKKSDSLLVKLGGNAALKAAVEEFYKRLLLDQDLAPFFEDINMAKLKMHQIKFMQVAFDQILEDMDVAAIMLEKHASLFSRGLNETHFDKVAVHFVETLQSLGIEQTLIDKAVAVIGPLRPVFEQGAKENSQQ